MGGGASSSELARSTESMIRVCLEPAVDAVRLSSAFLAPQSSLILTGASAALGPTPGMLGYGLAKAATHHLVKSLGGGAVSSAPCMCPRCPAHSV